jgi:hypothetical protein
MCLIHINEFAIHVSITARLSRLCIPFSKKLDSLLNRLDNLCVMHNFQCNTCASEHAGIETMSIIVAP